MAEPVAFCSLDSDQCVTALEWYFRLTSVVVDEQRTIGSKLTAAAFLNQLGEAICGLTLMPDWALTRLDRRQDVVMQVEHYGERVRLV